MNGLSLWPTGSKLIKMDDESSPLSKADADYFHRITAWLRFACKRFRPDIQVLLRSYAHK